MVFSTPAYLAFTSRLIPREDDETTYVSDKEPFLNENFGSPFAVELEAFVSPIGLPCTAPPWGYVAGADLRTGKTHWLRKNGTVRDRSPIPLPFKMGCRAWAGRWSPPVAWRFSAARWTTICVHTTSVPVASCGKARLPAGGQATPMTYQTRSGRQMVVVVAGGHGSLGTKAGIQSSLMPCRAARIAAFITGTPAMAAIGRYNSLQIVKHTGFGLYLDGGPDGGFCCPTATSPRMCRPRWTTG